MEYRAKKREVTPEKALTKLMNLCSRSEKCTFDIENLLKRWEIAPQHIPAIIERLKKDKFVDNQRYCDAYVREKSQISNYGERKIHQNLKLKRIDDQTIRNSFEKYISKDNMREKLKLTIEKKQREIEKRESDKYKIRDKLIRFAMSRGFDYDMIKEIIV